MAGTFLLVIAFRSMACMIALGVFHANVSRLVKLKYLTVPSHFFYAGGCKHLVAFLFWIHRRSEEPSPTSVLCYWKKSRLSTVGSKKFMTLQEMCGASYATPPGAVSSDFMENVKRMSVVNGVSNMLSTMEVDNINELSLHFLKVDFTRAHVLQSADCFLAFCQNSMSAVKCSKAEEETRGQDQSKLWYHLRYGRITASKLYEVAHCKTFDGSLVNLILGAKVFSSEAMKRGINLEDDVLRRTSQKHKMKFKRCGLVLDPEHPIFGASPDALGSAVVVEVKCPASKETFSNYLGVSNTVKPKYFAQIQLQMHMCKMNRGLFVVAHPDFEKSKRTTDVWVEYDQNYVERIMRDATKFWEKAVYQHL